MSSLWCRHQIETFSTLLDHYEGKPPVTGVFLSQRPVTRSLMFSLICEQSVEQTIETPVIWDAIALIMTSQSSHWHWPWSSLPDVVACVVLITGTTHGRHGVSHHWQLDCLFDILFRLTTTEVSKLHIIVHLQGDSTGSRWFPSQSTKFLCVLTSS